MSKLPVFTFRSATEHDLPLLHVWFVQPHVAEWWPVPKEQEDFFKTFLHRIRTGTRPFIVLCDGTPIGYIQQYRTDSEQMAWLPQFAEPSVGIDQFIGEPHLLGKGLGTLMIKAFIEYLGAERNERFIVVVDPDPANLVAIRCYEKVGFTKVGEFQAPYGPALLMVYRVSPLQHVIIAE